MDVTEIMTRPGIRAPETTVAAAERLMLQHRISGLPVVNERGGVIDDIVWVDPMSGYVLPAKRRAVPRDAA